MPYATDALAGKRILVVEDEYFLADYMESAVHSAGGEVQGPFPSAAQALAFIESSAERPDAATLNVSLTDGPSYPVADALVAIDIPFLFASATPQASLPSRFHRLPLLTKPFAANQVVLALQGLLDQGHAATEKQVPPEVTCD